MDSQHLSVGAILEMIRAHQITAEEGFGLIKKLRHDGPNSRDLEESDVHLHNEGDDGGWDSADKQGQTLACSSPTPQSRADDIAVVGISARFPDANNVSEYWQNLMTGRDSIREVSASRWRIEDYHGLDTQSPAIRAGLLSQVDCFDPVFFGISPLEAESMDPRQRLFLQEAWNALEDAGYSDRELRETKCGVFVGCQEGDYFQEFEGEPNPYMSLGNSSSILAARISYHLDLKGPSMAIDTSCSSSLVAVHLACQSIRSGESALAIAGGVTLMTTPSAYVALSKTGMLSPDGRCKAFDNGADGFVLGEGVGAVVLKSLEASLRDGDHVYGVIKGTALNYDGRTNGMTAPSAPSQTAVECEVYEKYHIHPETIGYVEAHGTGTKLGDPIEVEALTHAFRMYTNRKQYCPIGSVKTNIGHATAAAGIASLIKVLLCLSHKKLVPSLHFSSENDHIKFADTPFYVNPELIDWGAKDGEPRRAAISSFGFSGTNAHMVIEEAPIDKPKSPHGLKPYYLVPLSAKTEAALSRKIQDLAHWLEADGSQHSVVDIAYTLHVGRSYLPVRSALIVRDNDHLRQTIKDMREGHPGDHYVMNDATGNSSNLEHALRELGRRLIDELQAVGTPGDDEYREKLRAVAELYVGGCDLDWECLYWGEEPGRISLPTYPFAEERYWLPESDNRERPTRRGVELMRETEEAPESAPTTTTLSEDGEGRPISSGDSELTIIREEHGPVEDLDEAARDYVKAVFSEVLKIRKSDIDSQATFDTYGVTSLIGIEIKKRFEMDFGNLPFTLLFKYISVEDLARYFVKRHRDTLEAIMCTENTPTARREDGVSGGRSKKGQQHSPAPSPRNDQLRTDQYSELKEAAAPEAAADGQDIAIVGLAGRYPMSETLDRYWGNLRSGNNCISEIPRDRWRWEDYYDPNPTVMGKSHSRWGGFIQDADKFDPLFFNISPIQAEAMDPQERLFLEISWQVLEDAGYTRAELARRTDHKVGVFVGITNCNYELLAAQAISRGTDTGAHSAFWSTANRVSYCLDFQGPSLAIDTACSSSLTAIHMACESIRRGECRAAIAGGVNIVLHPLHHSRLSMVKVLSKDEKCRSFGDEANGFVVGEGVGAVLLKPLDMAISDRDHIYAVVKGSSINAGGRTSGYTVPNPNALAALVLEVLKESKVDPRTISYVEAHGTGTPLGDPIEILGLAEAFEEYTQDTQFCAIGSVKSNIGHLESAAGVAALTKVLLQLKHRQLAPSIHSETLNPNIDFENTPFYVQRELSQWRQPVVRREGTERRYPRRASVNSFATGGANAHLVLEEYENPVGWMTGQELDGPHVIVLSAKNEERLRMYARQMLDYLTTADMPEPMRPAHEEDVRRNIRKDLLKTASEVLNVAEENIYSYEDMKQYGLGETKLAEFADRINDKYKLGIEPDTLSEYPSIGSVTRYLLGKYRDGLLQYYGGGLNSKSGEGESPTSLTDIAYTLQVGRAPMEERLAVVVANLEELRQKLVQYCEGKPDIENLYRGNATTKNVGSDSLLEGKEGEEFLRAIIRDRKVDKLAHLWVSGLGIDWTLLYLTQAPHRVSLPTYPFARERYWIPEPSDSATIPGTEQGRGVGLRPPIGDDESNEVQVAQGVGPQIEDLKGIVSEVLRIDPVHLDHVDERTNLADLSTYGMDSVLFLEVLQAISRKYELDLRASDIVHLSTFKDLEDYVNLRWRQEPRELRLGKYNGDVGVKGSSFSGDWVETSDKITPDERVYLDKYKYAFPNTEGLRIFSVAGSQGIDVELLTCGEGHPLVLLPPIDSIATAWMHQIPQLSQRFQVIAFNYPGYGRSQFSYRWSDFDSIGDSVVDILDLLHIRRPSHFVGWSMGGLIAQIISARHSEKVETLTLVNTTSNLDEDDSVDSILDMTKALTMDFKCNLPEEMRGQEEALRNCIKGTSDQTISGHYFSQVLRFDYSKQVSEIHAPTLVIAGGRDELTPPKYARYIHDRVKSSEYHELEQGGHYIPLHNHAYFNQMLLDFIKSRLYVNTRKIVD